MDLGCGPGSYFPTLGRPLVGLDGAWAMVERARATDPEVAVVHGDLARLPFAPRSVGGAWARASYLHLRRHDLPVALAQLHRALAVGAPLEMTMRAGTGEGPLPDDEFPGRFFAQWRADDLADVVAGAGFDPSTVASAGEWHTVRARRGTVTRCPTSSAYRHGRVLDHPGAASTRAWTRTADAGRSGLQQAATNPIPGGPPWASGPDGRRRPVPGRPLAALVADGVGMTDLVTEAVPRRAAPRS